jgi:hypothetical protein
MVDTLTGKAFLPHIEVNDITCKSGALVDVHLRIVKSYLIIGMLGQGM